MSGAVSVTFDDTLSKLKRELNTTTGAEKVEYNPYDYHNHPELVTFDDCLYKLEGVLHYARYTMNEYMNTSPTTLYHYVKPRELLDSLSDDMYKLWRKIHDVREEVPHRVEQWTRKTDPNATSGSEDGSGGEDDITCYDKLPDSDFQSKMSDSSESYDSEVESEVKMSDSSKSYDNEVESEVPQASNEIETETESQTPPGSDETEAESEARIIA